MRQFLFPRHPLSRGTLLTCHLLLQFGLLAGVLLWLAPRTPWLIPTTWQAAWPSLALGGGLWLLAAVGLRLLVELWLLPHHLAHQRGGFPAETMVTRSFERRPAVHDPAARWTSEARPLVGEDDAVGEARVKRPAEQPQRRASEPTLDLDQPSRTEPAPGREPHL